MVGIYIHDVMKVTTKLTMWNAEAVPDVHEDYRSRKLTVYTRDHLGQATEVEITLYGPATPGSLKIEDLGDD